MRALRLPVSALLLLPLLCALVLASCGEGESEISGTIEAFGEHPVAGRKIVLCQLVEEQDAYTTPLRCLLQEQAAVSEDSSSSGSATVFTFFSTIPASAISM